MQRLPGEHDVIGRASGPLDALDALDALGRRRVQVRRTAGRRRPDRRVPTVGSSSASSRTTATGGAPSLVAGERWKRTWGESTWSSAASATRGT
ncbi:hypothetical protein [Streptomyces sp. NPDC058964]|uniref:hypothetical protein n=1 Tax=Streptomyces sp. NPDC058964 TaxID=3346681 RepID=UPI0036CB1914